MISPSLSIDLRYCRYEVYAPIRPLGGIVRTVFPDGLICNGARDERDPQNIREAAAQGYTGPLAVWRSLVEHELLHSLVAEVIFDRPSQVLRTEAGGEFTPTWVRYEEEMIALALQRHFQTGEVPEPLSRYNLNGLTLLWRLEIEAKLSVLWGAEESDSGDVSPDFRRAWDAA